MRNDAVSPATSSSAGPPTRSTRAVGIEAPAADVWRWLVQIGVGRGGMYSYDWLENLIGLHIHSAETIRDEWQHLSVGDRVVAGPRWVDGHEGRLLVARRDDRSGPSPRAASVATRASVGCRLVVRDHSDGHRQAAGLCPAVVRRDSRAWLAL